MVGGSSLGLGRPVLFWGSFSSDELYLSYSFSWVDLLILNSIFFPLGLVQFPLAQRLSSSVYYFLSTVMAKKNTTDRGQVPPREHPPLGFREWVRVDILISDQPYLAILSNQPVFGSYDWRDHCVMTEVVYPKWILSPVEDEILPRERGKDSDSDALA